MGSGESYLRIHDSREAPLQIVQMRGTLLHDDHDELFISKAHSTRCGDWESENMAQ